MTLCKALRELDPETPILFYSGRAALPVEKEAALRAGAQDYLIKPPDLFNVPTRVKKWIEASKPGKAG